MRILSIAKASVVIGLAVALSACAAMEAQKEAQEKLAHLVPNAKHISSTNSGHEIQKEQPQLVVDAIRQVVDAVRGGSRRLAR